MRDSDDLGDFFAPPPFKASEAWVQLRRQLRDLKLQERSGSGPDEPVRFSLKALDVAELSLGSDPSVIRAAIVKRPAARPDWQRHTLDSSVAVRRWLDDLKRQLVRWSEDD